MAYNSLIDGFASATFKSPSASNGRFHCFGFYDAPATEAALTNASATQTYGTANLAYGAKAFWVAKEAGTATGGTTGTAKITVTGTSIADNGTRTASDSEIIVADVTAMTTNKYYETTKYWIGTVTYTIATTGDRTTFTGSGNYGFAKYFEFFDNKVRLNHFEATGRGGATDTGFDIQLLKHDGTGWTYSAAAFVPGGTVICSLATDYSTEKELSNGKRFAYERYGLNTVIDGSSGTKGVVCRITTSANNAVESSDYRLRWYYVGAYSA